MSDWTSISLPAIVPAQAISALQAVLRGVRAAQDAARARDAFLSLSVSAATPTIPSLPSIGDISTGAAIHALVVPVVSSDPVSVAPLISPLTVAAQLGLDPDTVITSLAPNSTRFDDGVRRLADVISRSLTDVGDSRRPLYDAHAGITCLALVAAADDPAEFCTAAAALEFATSPSRSIMNAMAPPPRDLMARGATGGVISLSLRVPQPTVLTDLRTSRSSLFLGEDPTCLRARRSEDFLGSSPVDGLFQTQLGKLRCIVSAGLPVPFRHETWKYAAVAQEYVSEGRSCWSGLSDWSRLPIRPSSVATSTSPDWIVMTSPLALRADLENVGRWGKGLRGRVSADTVLERARAKSEAASGHIEAALRLLSGGSGGVYATSFSGTGGTAYLLSELVRRITASDGPGSVPRRYAAGVFVVFGAAGIGSVPGNFEFVGMPAFPDPLLTVSTVPATPLFGDDFIAAPSNLNPPPTSPLVTALSETPVLTPAVTIGNDLSLVTSTDERNAGVLNTGKEPVRC